MFQTVGITLGYALRNLGSTTWWLRKLLVRKKQHLFFQVRNFYSLWGVVMALQLLLTNFSVAFGIFEGSNQILIMSQKA